MAPSLTHPTSTPPQTLDPRTRRHLSATVRPPRASVPARPGAWLRLRPACPPGSSAATSTHAARPAPPAAMAVLPFAA